MSTRIKELERDLGILLFDRRQRTPRLTTSGRSLLPHADKMLRLFSEMREHVGHPDLLQGVLRLGVAEVISITWLPRLLKQIHERFPRLVVELDEALTQDLVTRLQAGSLDLILTPGRVVGYNSSAMSLGYVHFVWMASPDLPLPRKRMGREIYKIGLLWHWRGNPIITGQSRNGFALEMHLAIVLILARAWVLQLLLPRQA